MIATLFNLAASRAAAARTGSLCRLLAACLLAGALGACVSSFIEKGQNTVVPDPAAPGPASTSDLPFIADLHADSLLWDRDLLEKSGYGHVDLPRLVSGNVGLQVFAVVTKTPLHGPAPDPSRLIPEVRNRMDLECIDAANLNLSGLLYFVQLRPIETWFDLEARAMNQAERLKAFIARSAARRASYLASGGDPAKAPPVLVLIRTAGDLAKVIERRRQGDTHVVGALLALEGAHWIEGDEAAVKAGVGRLFDADFRMLAPTHRFSNALGHSSEGCNQIDGLTDAGKMFLREAEQRRMIVDLAHASDRAILDGTMQANGPVVISHTGVRFDCPQDGEPERRCTIERGMTEEGVRAVARTGGIIGVGYWPQAVGPGVKRIASAYQSTMKVLSDDAFRAEMEQRYGRYEPSEHLSLGSDFDGAVEVPFDVTGLGILFKQLGEDGDGVLDATALRRVAGINACRVFATRLPHGSADRAAEICGALTK